MNNRDLPNGDIKSGDFIRVTGWCLDKQALKPMRVGPTAVGLMPGGDPNDENSVVNRTLFDNVVRVIGVDYPCVLICAYDISGQHGFGVIDAREFECKVPSTEYLEQFLKVHHANRRAATPWYLRWLQKEKT